MEDLGEASWLTRQGWTGEHQAQDKSKKDGRTRVGGAEGLRGDSAGRAEGLGSAHMGFTNSSLGLYRTDILLRNDSLDQHGIGRHLRDDPLGQHFSLTGSVQGNDTGRMHSFSQSIRIISSAIVR